VLRLAVCAGGRERNCGHGRACCAAEPSCIRRSDRSAYMTHRHYGVPMPKPRPTHTGPAPGGAWGSGPILGGIVVILIVLGVVLYGLSRTLAEL